LTTATPGTTAPVDPKQALDDPNTPTGAYKAAYAARKACDLQKMKKLFAKDAIEFLTEIGKVGKKSLDEMIKEMCANPQGDTDETRNEKVDGNRATLEYKTDKGEWQTMDLAKEEGVWKLSLPKADGDKDNQ
jgi:hypothetical protein